MIDNYSNRKAQSEVLAGNTFDPSAEAIVLQQS